MDNITSAEFICDLLAVSDGLNLNSNMKTALCKARYETMCKHSHIQEYKCQAPIIFSKQCGIDTIYVDTCLQTELCSLIRGHGVLTVGSCCGHGKKAGFIQVAPHSVKKMVDLGYVAIPPDEHGNGLNCFKPKTILYIDEGEEL